MRQLTTVLSIVVLANACVVDFGDEALETDVQEIGCCDPPWRNGNWAHGIWSAGMWKNYSGATNVWTGAFTEGVLSPTLTQNWPPYSEPGLVKQALKRSVLENHMYVKRLLFRTYAAGDTGLTQGQLAESVLKYVYACAMPEGKKEGLWLYKPTNPLSPPVGGGGGVALPREVGGIDSGYTRADVDELGGVDAMYAFGFQIKWPDKYVLLEGKHGVAPEWATGPCNAECQEEVSACLGALTNAYGEHVYFDAVGSGLGQLRSDPYKYDFQEAAFWGNLFAPTPWMKACAGNGTPEHRLVKDTVWSYMAPDLSKRLCGRPGDSSTGTGCPGFEYMGACEELCDYGGAEHWDYCFSSSPAILNALWVYLEGSVLSIPLPGSEDPLPPGPDYPL